MRALPGVVLAVAVACASIAHAQSIDPAAATELFKQGRALMEKGDYTAACPKFAESARLDAKVGTLLNLAECEDKLGQIAEARQHLQLAIDRARIDNDDRLQLATDKLAAIDARVPRLTVALSAGAPPSTVVQRDGVLLEGASLDNALPVDPGHHVIVASADGYEAKSFTVDLKESEKQRIEVAPGAKLPATTKTTTSSANLSTTSDASPSSSSSATRTWGFVIGGLGIVGLGVGTVYGFVALSKNSDSKSNGACDANNVCDAAGKSARDDARRAGNVSTFAFVVGGVAVAAGAVLILAGPSSSKPDAARIEAAPLVGTTSGGLLLRGAW
jgi:tetratricopeptide (TPR) repeat protein